MTDKKWNKEEYDEVRKLQIQNEWSGYLNAIESQKRLYEECSDPVQKERYLKGLKILERNVKKEGG